MAGSADKKSGDSPGGTVPKRIGLWVGLAMGLVTTALVVGAFAPVRTTAREELFEIPEGTWARRMAGDKVDVLPRTVYLTLGVRDVLLLRNRDKVPQMFGPVLIMPGQDFRLPFEVASHNQFDCTAHSSGQMEVIVDPEPTPGWQRLQWRVRAAMRPIISA